MANELVLFDATARQWLHFTAPTEIIKAETLDDVLSSMETVERAVHHNNLFAAGFVSFEAAPAFDPALETHSPGRFPLLWFGLFHPPQIIELPDPILSIHPVLHPTVTMEAYDNEIGSIKYHIRKGDTYQVNYTFKLRGGIDESPWALFLQMIQQQRCDYGAFVSIEDYTVCSASPELFFRLQNHEIISRPMKGTTSRGRFPQEDKSQKEWLSTSEKNRAENVMIVDMIRNDIGRIAEPGSVQVIDLFGIEKYPNVWQMTSTVKARTNAGITSIFTAMFPCGSVTGAPKASTMKIIRTLEPEPRNIYTGSIGFISPEGNAQFNVAIRSMLIDNRRNEAEFGVGSGVVWQSRAGDEYDECIVKAKILANPEVRFSLFETILYEGGKGYFLLDYHLRRLRNSADFFDFPFDEQSVLAILHTSEKGFTGEPMRVRIAIDQQGQLETTSSAMPETADDPVKISLSKAPVNSSDLFLFHKTTNRRVYDQALSDHPECEEVLLWNERDEITETPIANIVLEQSGVRSTPPILCGLLAGTLRESLLESGQLRERILTKEDVQEADNVFLINSVRGWRRAVLV